MSTSNEGLLESWQLSLHNKRPGTVATYVREIQAFVAWLSEHGDDDLAAVTKQDLRLWIAWSKDRGMKPNTIRSRFFVIRAFYRWAVSEGEVATNPTVGVEMGRLEAPPPNVLTDDQIARLLKACEGAGFRERRDAALFRLMLATGARVSEAAAIEAGDLDLLSRLAVIREGKGGKPRVTRFDAQTAAAIDRYKRVRARHRFASLPNLWLGERGAFTTKGIALALDRRAEAAGIGHVHPHQTRHTWAHRYLNGGGKEGDLKQLGGWESEQVMRRYGQAQAVDRALRAYDDVDPMRGL